jgi:hypothetical protein
MVGFRSWSWGLPTVLAIIEGVAFWLFATIFIAWSARKAFPY